MDSVFGGDTMSKGFVFVRNNPSMFEAPDWVPDKARLYKIINTIYNSARVDLGHTRAERLVHDTLEYIAGLGMTVATDLVNEAKVATLDAVQHRGPGRPKKNP